MKILQICQPNLSDLGILPWKIQKSFSTVLLIHTSGNLRYLTRKQTVIHLPTRPENVTTLTCEMQNFFIWLKVSCVFSNLGGSEESQLWVVIGGSEKNRLWRVATRMSNKQRHSKCSEWPPFALIHASSLFRHWSVAWCTTLCWNSAPSCRNKQLPQAATCPYQYTRSSYSVPRTQY